MGKTEVLFKCADTRFCPSCGSLLPSLPETGNVRCLACRMEVPIETFANTEMHYQVIFNKRENLVRSHPGKKSAAANDDDAKEGPTVERKCSRCGHDEMSYATLQLRSADEGQTVFFTCLKCKFKETENS